MVYNVQVIPYQRGVGSVFSDLGFSGSGLSLGLVPATSEETTEGRSRIPESGRAWRQLQGLDLWDSVSALGAGVRDDVITASRLDGVETAQTHPHPSAKVV